MVYYYHSTQLGAPTHLACGDSGYIMRGGEASGQGQFQPAHPEHIASTLHYVYPLPPEVTYPVSTEPQHPFLQHQQPHHRDHHHTCPVCLLWQLMTSYC